MKNKIIKRRWHWPTLLGDLQITTGPMGSASIQLNGHTLSHHIGPEMAARAAQHHNTGHQEWDQQQLPTPPLAYWGEIIEVAF